MVGLGIVGCDGAINHRTKGAAMLAHEWVNHSQINVYQEHKEYYDEGYIMGN